MDELQRRGARQRRNAPAAAFESLESRTLFSTIEWDGGPDGLGTTWSNPANWAGDVLPAEGDDCLINTGVGVIFDSGAVILHTLNCTQPLTIQGGSLGVADSGAVAGNLLLDGGQLAGGVWIISTLTATASQTSSLAGVTLLGDLSLDADNARITVTGGLTVNGLISIQGDGAALIFDGGSQVFAGNADVLFSGFSGVRSISADSGAILTIASSVSISGERAQITGGLFAGSGSVINAGTIWADTGAGTIEISPSVFTNTGTLRATGDGTLKVTAGAWTTSGTISINDGTIALGGTLDVTSGIGTFSRSGGTVAIAGTIANTGGTLALNASTGSWQFDGGQILGGTISLTGGASLLAFPLRSGRIAQATINGNLSWTVSNFYAEFDAVTLNGNLTFSGFSTLSISNGLTLNGAITISGDDTTIQFDGAPESIAGNATIFLRHQNCFFWAHAPLTIPANVAIMGYGHMFGLITNMGSIVSDTPGKSLIIANGNLHSSGGISVAAGASLFLGDTVASATTITNIGSIHSEGGIIAIGPTSGSGPVTLNNSGMIQLTAGATLTAGTQFVFHAITVNNSGSLELTGSIATFGTSDQLIPVALTNSGIIASGAASQVHIRTPATTAQLGDLRASGGAVLLHSNVDNASASLLQSTTTGAWTLSGGSILGGTLVLSAGICLIPDEQTSNTLSGVSIQGHLTLTLANARLRIVGGLTLFGTLSITGANAAASFDGGNQLVSGKGTIRFAGTKGFQTFSADNGASVTLDSGISISGDSGSGRLLSGFIAGTGSFVNNGTIRGTLTINATGGFTNNGSVQAALGAQLTVTGLVTNYSAGTLTGGTWRVFAGSAIHFQPGPITTSLATISLDTPTSSFPALAALASNGGSLSLSGGRILKLASLVNSGTIDLQPESQLSIAEDLTMIGAATLRLSISAKSFPKISVGGTASLAGSLDVSWLGGYHPADSSSFVFLMSGATQGTFDAFSPQSLGANRRQFLTYNPQGVTLNVWAVWRDD